MTMALVSLPMTSLSDPFLLPDHGTLVWCVGPQIVFKQGDDVRQDQLVINIIQLMDRLLKKEKLDLQLTSYKVLATGSSQGAWLHTGTKGLDERRGAHILSPIMGSC